MSAYIREHGHEASVKRKRARIDGLELLKKTHEQSDNPDWIYIMRLDERIKREQKQLDYMRP